MSGFSADWLTLREPYDLNARNLTVIDAAAASLEPLSSVRVVDLACGTGSTMRALSPFLPARQSWKLIDNDLSLLARAKATPVARNTAINVIPLDLNRDLEAALDGAVDLVATSALLDLVSESWLDRLDLEVLASRRPDNAILVVTHYERLLHYIVPDFVHIMLDGRLVMTGGKDLAKKVDTQGYDWVEKEVALTPR